MAHIAKYKAHSCGHMLAHYRRDKSSLGRDNIDQERTKNNYVLQVREDERGALIARPEPLKDGEPNWSTIEQRIERVDANAREQGKRATRKDAVVLADVVITLPDNVRKGDEKKFFAYTYLYLANEFGSENMLGGHVHRDEVTKDGAPARDHMHVPFTPILNGRFNYKEMVPRTFYQTLHGGLGDYLEQRLGYRPAVELDEETRAKRVYTDKSKDIEKVRGAVERGVVRPAEKRAKFAEERAERSEAKYGEIQRQIAEETERLECLRQAREGIERRIEQLEPIVAATRKFKHEKRSGKIKILNQIVDRCNEFTSGIRAGIERIKQRINELSAPKYEHGYTGSIFDMGDMLTDIARDANATHTQRGHVSRDYER